MSIPGNWQSHVVSNDGWYVDGNGELRSNIITNLGSTSLILNITSDISIDVRVSSETSCDWFRIYNSSLVEITTPMSGTVSRSIPLLASESPYKFTYSKDGSANVGEDAAFISNIPAEAFFFFDGDFTTLSQSDYDTSVAPDIILSIGAVATLNVGVGLVASGTGSIYVKATEFNTGDVIAVKDASDVTLFEYTVTTTKIYTATNNGFTYLFDENGNSLTAPAVGKSYLRVDSGNTLTNVYYHAVDYTDEITSTNILFTVVDVIFANPNQTPEEAIAGLPPTAVFAELAVPLTLLKCHGHASIINSQGELRPEGYYQSTVTVSGAPAAGMKVFCFTNYGELVDITCSDASGVYRFDELLTDRKYMFVAQHDDGDPNTPPEYLATASDWQTPTAY